MPGPEPRLHLPYAQWPAADRLLWERAMGSDDPFRRCSRCSLGQGLAARLSVRMAAVPRVLGDPRTHRIGSRSGRTAYHRARPSVRRPSCRDQHSTIGRGQVDALYKAARVMMPERDWTWLKAVKARLYRGGARVCSNRARHYQPPAARSWAAADGREQTNTGHPDQQGRCHPLPRRVDDRAPRLHSAPA